LVFFRIRKRKLKIRVSPTIKTQMTQPVIVVTGATGTGKSKLGVDLALALRSEVECEIVSCDAMQFYRGLAIATNQPTVEEQRGIPHHLIACQDPLDSVDVVIFAQRAWQCIDDIHRRGHLPLIVGGTLYYLEVLLGLLVPQPRPSSSTTTIDLNNNNNNNNVTKSSQTTPENRTEKEWDKLSVEEICQLLRTKPRRERIEWINKQSSSFLFSFLERVDSARARKLHPNDRRRVCNSILV
jgi:tRNA dimethylallyltransferase